jgi:hypothetical protein
MPGADSNAADRAVRQFWEGITGGLARDPNPAMPPLGAPFLAAMPRCLFHDDPGCPGHTDGTPVAECMTGVPTRERPGGQAATGDLLAKTFTAAAAMAARELGRPDRRAFWAAWTVALAYCGNRGMPFLPSLIAAELAGAGASMAWRAAADLRTIAQLQAETAENIDAMAGDLDHALADGG